MNENSSRSKLTSRSTIVRDLGVLLAVVLVTRIPLLGIAEPDSALFTTGARQWLQGGPYAVSIYSQNACALYYAFVTALIRHLGLDAQSCPELMSVISLIAGLGITLFGYLIGLRFVGPRNVFWAMLLFIVSPGLWWVTVEPHPQAISIAFGLAGVWCFLRYLEEQTRWFLAGSVMSLGIAMVMKNDAVLMVPGLLAVAFWVDPRWRTAFRAMAIGAGAAGLAMCLDRLATGNAAGPITGGQQAVKIFGRIPKLIDLLREGAPIIFGLGLIAAVALGIGIIIALRKDPERHRWLAVLALWCVPGYLFWLFIAGNDIRHVLAFGIPLFWLGTKHLNRGYVAGCVILGFLIPGNSNVFMFPSPNVPASARLFAQRQAYLRGVADQLSKQPSCFVGSYTSDYLVSILLDKGGRIDSQLSNTDTSAASVTMPNRAVITFKRISTAQKFVALGSCRSLEYNTEGRKIRPFGGEWHIPII
jgi:4-amino-4-deoxy-L-arabinose transferase-like glycosyltransferase